MFKCNEKDRKIKKRLKRFAPYFMIRRVKFVDSLPMSSFERLLYFILKPRDSFYIFYATQTEHCTLVKTWVMGTELPFILNTEVVGSVD